MTLVADYIGEYSFIVNCDGIDRDGSLIWISDERLDTNNNNNDILSGLFVSICFGF